MESSISDTPEMTTATEVEKRASSTPVTSTTTEGPLYGWTKDEKYELYLAIKSKGSRQVNDIQKSIPNKTLMEIEEAISHYRVQVNKNPECATRKLKARKVRTKPLIPLALWAKALTDNFNYEELQTEIATALRLIADMENIPDPSLTDQVNFRTVYHHLANAMEGKALTDDRMTMEVINSCLLDTALVSKVFIKASTYRHILSSVNLKRNEIPIFPRPTENIELSIIRQLAGLVNYNPMNITEEHLTAAGSAQNSNTVGKQ